MTEELTKSTSTPNATRLRLTKARSASAWLGSVSLILAFTWWVGAFTGIITYFGVEVVQQAPIALIISGAALIILPGLMLAMAALLAREQARSRAVNDIVFEAAARLLSPAETLSAEATVFAEDMVKASASVDRSMGHALSALKAMAAEIGDERARLESVTYASADNARDLAERMGNERTGLEALAKDLREQTGLLNEAIPAQAEMMVKSAQAAAQEVTVAEDALLARLASLDETSTHLAQKISTLDTLAAEASERNEALLFAIDRMEEKLEQSRKTVETAARAGELAAAAASTTGDRLLESVNAALDGAKQASEEIQRQADAATQQSLSALQSLKQAGKDTAAAVRSVGIAARAEADLSDQRASNAEFSRSLREKSQDISERMNGGANGRDTGHSATVELTAAQPEPPAPEPVRHEPTHQDTPRPSNTANRLNASPSVTVEEDLFEANADRMAEAVLNGEHTESQAVLRQPKASLAQHRPDIFEEDQNQVVIEIETPVKVDTPSPAAPGGNSLSEIIADMEREERSDLSREDTATALLDKLQTSGMRLNDIFRPKDKRKIAMAARKGELPRRIATNKQAGRQVERVRQRLRGNLELTSLARNFLDMETQDALNALENTRGSSKNASARLATFLLLDAALE